MFTAIKTFFMNEFDAAVHVFAVAATKLDAAIKNAEQDIARREKQITQDIRDKEAYVARKVKAELQLSKIKELLAL